MLSQLIGAWWNHPLLFARLTVLLFPLAFFWAGRGQAFFGQGLQLNPAAWLSVLQLLVTLICLAITQVFVQASRRSPWTRWPLSVLRLGLKCAVGLLIGTLSITL